MCWKQFMMCLEDTWFVDGCAEAMTAVKAM